MQLPTTLSLAVVLSLQLSSVLAIPIAEPVQPEGELEKCTGTGTQADPFISLFQRPSNNVNGSFLPSSPNLLIELRQYEGAGSSDAQRMASGTGSTPFRKKGGSPTMAGGKVEMPPSHQDWMRPEDTTNTCAIEAGYDTQIAPVDPKHNSRKLFFWCTLEILY